MSGYEFDPKDKDGSLRDRFDCYCKEVIGRAAHNLVFKQAQYLILHFGGGEIDPSMMMHEDEHDKGCTGVTEVCLDGDDFSKTYTVSGMFEGCMALESADLTTATWGTLEKYTRRMFADDPKFTEIKVPSDFTPDAVCQEMFQVDKLTKLTEGAETYEQLLFYVRCGCDYAQGNVLGRPLCEEDFLQLFKERAC